MIEAEPDIQDRSTILIHYYRAMVGRADTWRMRMDATTNWAIVATAAVISFALGNDTVPHYGVFIASLMTLTFLFLEARRLTFYHLWQQRVLLLEDGLIRPTLWAGAKDDAPDTGMGMTAFRQAVDAHLGRTAPNMPIGKAAARRMRRVYVYLFAVQLVAWVLKLSSHPTPARSLSELTTRADIAGVPGAVVFGIATGGLAVGVIVAAAFGGRDQPPNAQSAPAP